MSKNNFSRIFFLVKFAAFAVFIGRAWQHLVWDAPFRTLLWDEEWMSQILPWFSNMTYEEFITDVRMDDKIQNVIKGFGVFYLWCAVVILLIKNKTATLANFFEKYIIPVTLWLGALSLMFLALLYCKEKFWQWGQFWEYSLQFGSPIFLFFLWKKQNVTPAIILLMKIAIAITFISHGLYALNYYPRPGHFVQMVMDSLPVSEATAILILNLAGVLDFLLAIGIFIKGKVGKFALLYAVFWGFATTLARIWGHFYLDMMEDTLTMWVHEAVYRMPHFLIPLAVYYYERVQDMTYDKGSL